MILFLFIVLIIYGSFHFYFYLKIRNAFNLAFPFNTLLIFFLLLLMFAPFFLRIFEKKGFHLLSLIIAYCGFFWMGVLFLFIVSSFFIEAYKLLGGIVSFFLKKNISFINPSAKISFLIPFILSVLISIYGYYEARNIRLEKIKIYSPKLPKSIKSFKIAQISDIHIGLIMSKERIKKIIDIIKSIEPDLLVCTGDMIDAEEDKINDFASLFAEIQPKYGKFAVTGNHEFYFGIEKALEFFKKSGFITLHGEIIKLNDWLSLAGIDDPTAKYFGLNYRELNLNLLAKISEKDFLILLKHRPTLSSFSKNYFDLQLSGHTHKGQIFPFNFFTGLLFPLAKKQFHKFGNSYVYVSNGTGFWGPPIRFLAPPEIALIELSSIQ